MSQARSNRARSGHAHSGHDHSGHDHNGHDRGNRCEVFELEISTLIDGELPAAEALAVTDHLLQCPDCQQFYRLVRGVDQALDEARLSAGTGDLPLGLWSRIDASVGEAGAAGAGVVSMPRLSPAVPAWLWKVAAAVLIVAGLWSAGRLWSPSGLADGALQVHLESDRGAMTDQRFLEITTELLRADHRYHRKMLEIMAAISRHSSTNEGGEEPSAPVQVGPDGELPGTGDNKTGVTTGRRSAW